MADDLGDDSAALIIGAVSMSEDEIDYSMDGEVRVIGLHVTAGCRMCLGHGSLDGLSELSLIPGASQAREASFLWWWSHVGAGVLLVMLERV